MSSLTLGTKLLEKLRAVLGCKLHYTEDPREHSWDKPGTIVFVLGADEKGGDQIVNALARQNMTIAIENRNPKNSPKKVLSRCVSIIYDAFHTPCMRHLVVHPSIRLSEKELKDLFYQTGQTVRLMAQPTPSGEEGFSETSWVRYEIEAQHSLPFTRATEEQIAQHRAR